jgi:hypothetical protein
VCGWVILQAEVYIALGAVSKGSDIWVLVFLPQLDRSSGMLNGCIQIS